LQIIFIKLDELVKVVIPVLKAPTVGEGGYPDTLQLFKKTGFPIEDFGNDRLKKYFLRNH